MLSGPGAASERPGPARAAYSTDASNYRQVPIGVVPHTVEAGVVAVAACREHGAPVVSRGGGTSLAGQTCNVAVVIDWSMYCHGVVSVDAGAKTRARAVPGPGRYARGYPFYWWWLVPRTPFPAGCCRA